MWNAELGRRSLPCGFYKKVNMKDVRPTYTQSWADRLYTPYLNAYKQRATECLDAAIDDEMQENAKKYGQKN